MTTSQNSINAQNIHQFISNLTLPATSGNLQATSQNATNLVTEIPNKNTQINLEKIQQSLTQSPVPTIPPPNTALMDQMKPDPSTDIPTNVLLTIAFYNGQAAKKDTQSAQLTVINNNTNQTISANTQQQAALQDSYDQMAKSARWQKAQKVFSALTMVIGAVVLVSTIATGGLASAAFLALGAAISIGLMIDSNNGSPVMGAITDFMTNISTKIVGVTADFLSNISGGKIDISEETQEKLSNLLGQVMAGLLVFSAIALTTVGGIKTMKNKTIVLGNGKQKPFMNILAETIRKVGKITQGAFRISGGASQIGASVYNYKGQIDQVMAEEWGVFLKAMQSYSNTMSDSLQAIIDSIAQQNQTILNMMQELSQTDTSMYRNLSKSV